MMAAPTWQVDEPKTGYVGDGRPGRDQVVSRHGGRGSHDDKHVYAAGPDDSGIAVFRSRHHHGSAHLRKGATMAKIGVSVLVAFSILLSAATAISATDEQICRAGRARAAGKYEKCVQDWLGAFYKTGSADQLKLSRCRLKYALAFMKLQGLSGTTCDARRWVDNGDGTVTDNLTGLVWEQKSDDGTVHDWDDLTTLTSALDGDLTDEDGPAFTTFLSSLNSGGGFAGANGWRMPSFAELQTIILPGLYPCIASPCIDAAFGPFTKSGLYASVTTSASNPLDALAVNFADGYAQAHGKSIVTRVRAVRGGF